MALVVVIINHMINNLRNILDARTETNRVLNHYITFILTSLAYRLKRFLHRYIDENHKRVHNSTM